LIARNPFAAWVVVGVLIGFSLAVAPLFVVTLPLAIVGTMLVRRRTRERKDLLGVVCGVGLVLLATPLRAIGAAALIGGIALHATVGRRGSR